MMCILSSKPKSLLEHEIRMFQGTKQQQQSSSGKPPKPSGWEDEEAEDEGEGEEVEGKQKYRSDVGGNRQPVAQFEFDVESFLSGQYCLKGVSSFTSYRCHTECPL